MDGVQDVWARVLATAGGISVLARRCGVSPQAASKWRNRIPAERVLQVERATDGEVSRHDLRPDLYPRPDSEAA